MGQACGEAGSSVPVPRHVCTIAFCLPLWPRWGAQGLAIPMVKWPKRRGLSWPWLPQRGGQWVAVGLSVPQTPPLPRDSALGLAECLPLCLSCLRPPWCSERGRRARRGVEGAAGAGGAGEMRQPGNSTRAGSPEETAAQYAVIAIVPIFCLMGLLGILVCNLLKRKGYHCTAQKEVGPGPGGGGSGEAQPGVEWEARGPGLAQPSSAWGHLRQSTWPGRVIRRLSWRCGTWAN